MAERVAVMKQNFVLVYCSVLLCMTIYTEKCFAAIGEWKNFTDMKNITAIASTANDVWCGTSGGVFRYRISDSSFQKFSNSEGLSSNNITALAIDKYGSVWIGQNSGAIDVYSPSTQTWRYVRDIILSTKVHKSIRNFFMQGDSLYISTDFGISLFSISKFEFSDTYSNLGALAQPSVGAAIFSEKKIWAITTQGIAVSKIGATNLAAPESWDTYPSINDGYSINEFHGKIYVGSGQGFLTFNNGVWTKINGINSAVRTLASTDTVLYYTDGRTIFTFSTAQTIQPYSVAAPGGISCGTLQNSSTLFVGLIETGLGFLNPTRSQWKVVAPNGPASNYFSSIVIDENNTVWCTSGGVGGKGLGKGFYSYNGKEWKNYNIATTPSIPSNDCFSIALGANNSKWISTWGAGLILVNSKGDVARVFNRTNAGFIGTPENNNYIVAGTVATDRFGNPWTTVFEASVSSKAIWKMKPDSLWEPYPAGANGYKAMLGTVIDRNNTKWFVNVFPDFLPSDRLAPKAVFFNESINIAGTSDGWGTISKSDGITETAITSIVVDKDGAVWMSTTSGVTIITDPQQPLKRISKVLNPNLRDQYITCIAIDPLNNKWLGTPRGIFVLSPDGTTLLNQYTVENTNGKLVDNNVLAIAFDMKRGIAYFGTEKGLSSMEIAATASVEKYATIEVAPNPFLIPNSGSVMIRGLVDDSMVKVLTINGTLVNQFSAQGGGRAFWNGKKSNGEYVASGIYLFVVYTQNGSQVAAAKVAVIRK